MRRAIALHGRRTDVVETLDRWYGRDYCYVKVKSRDGSVYILRLDETHTEWELTMFQRAQDGGPRPSTTLADLVYAAILCRDFFGSAGIAEAVA